MSVVDMEMRGRLCFPWQVKGKLYQSGDLQMSDYEGNRKQLRRLFIGTVGMELGPFPPLPPPLVFVFQYSVWIEPTPHAHTVH